MSQYESMKSTSLRQGRSREGRSGGSRRQNHGAMNKNAIEGPVSGVSQHLMTKPIDSGLFDEGPNLGRMRCSVAPVLAMMPIGGAEGRRIDGGSVSKETRLLLFGRWPDATREPPSAEPHARWYGEGELNTPLYPLRPHALSAWAFSSTDLTKSWIASTACSPK